MIVNDIDRKPFEEATKPLRDELAADPRLGPLIQQIGSCAMRKSRDRGVSRSAQAGRRRNPVTKRQCGELFGLGGEERNLEQ